MDNRKKYPECFPDNIEELIKEDGADANRYMYYRISRTGLINRDAFASSYEESIKYDIPGHNRDIYRASKEAIDIGDYSTSGYEKFRDAKKRYKCMKKYEDGPIIMVGITDPECGLSMRTKDSKTRTCSSSHIDWWIYEDVHPEVLFEKVILNER